MTADAITELWSSYRADPTRDLRDRLILHYSQLVVSVAPRRAPERERDGDRDGARSGGASVLGAHARDA